MSIRTATLLASLLATSAANAGTVIEHAFFNASVGTSAEFLLQPPGVVLPDFDPNIGNLQSATVDIVGRFFPSVTAVLGTPFPPVPTSFDMEPALVLFVGAAPVLNRYYLEFPDQIIPAWNTWLYVPVAIDLSYSLDPANTTSSQPFSGLSGPGIYVGAVSNSGLSGYAGAVDNSNVAFDVTVTYTYDTPVFTSLSIAPMPTPEPSTALLLAPILFLLTWCRKPS